MIDVDYLVVGAGAMGMAFVDTLLTESDATVAIVDRYQQPGGHWTIAYPYVRLHQPSAFYGVNSRELGSGTADEVGWNAGLDELASGPEVCAYFDQVMRQRFLPSGRVAYFPMSEYRGAGRFHSLVTGEKFEVRARRIVDATYMKVSVPAMRPPAYEVAPGARCVTPNALARTDSPADHYTVVGGGKTGIDACLWLLAQGADPDRLTWIVPRDAWLLNRANIQQGPRHADAIGRMMAARAQAVVDATSRHDLFDRLEACEGLMRLSQDVRPTAYRCATVTRLELGQLQRIKDVVRMGRVRKVGVDEIVLDHGTIPTTPGTVHVDCTADGLAPRPVVPVFAGDHLTLQAVLVCQQVASAAMIAHVEATRTDDETKNELCAPIPHPSIDAHWITTTRASVAALRRWQRDPDQLDWLVASRLVPNFGGRAPDELLRVQQEKLAALA
ncbi:NAD(P)/FAD-dependent oxidoreductase [Actinocrispum wychmicini]|uniref:Pyridine nucleotide-disulfide oxidoreductase n=1 Tax=Actinocrispum wychmicini TaxID=1213861 RepID=A0A4R2JAH8_9PSEU|nr:NAD(P)/FAD-dependent oxidoreductase [Actinocrispum wychmicini]TCO54862.1 hypothetical protein EV192_108150 [Actinocrispum wychmicini]